VCACVRACVRVCVCVYVPDAFEKSKQHNYDNVVSLCIIYRTSNLHMIPNFASRFELQTFQLWHRPPRVNCPWGGLISFHHIMYKTSSETVYKTTFSSRGLAFTKTDFIRESLHCDILAFMGGVVGVCV
jgi:hypothetical protein